MPHHYRLITLFIGILLLPACHQANRVKAVGPNQLLDLSSLDNYQFSGKMSFSDGQDGGSGSIHWQRRAGLISAKLKAPLGSKSWQISEQQYGAEMIANGNIIVADSAQTLISSQLGWQVPWQPLKSWVIGQPHQANQAQVAWQPDGFIIYEDGWTIEYSRLKSDPNLTSKQLAHKMVARNKAYAIKLIVKQWQW